SISSFGELSYFTPNHAPSGAPAFCMEGCPIEKTCPYFAPRVYTNAPDWMRLAVSNDLSNESMLSSIQKGPYGRCVFHSDNDVVDHQVLILEFPKGVTASFTMTAFTHENTRTIKLMGSTGEIRGHMEKGIVELYLFGRDEVISIQTNQGSSGHGGGDEGIMKAYIELLNQEPTSGIHQVNGAISAHLTAFAAEISRHEKKTVLYEDYVKQVMDSGRTNS
ncbi:MAG: hypothetical protein U1C51_03740, partial [Candidatus Izemoplasmatales bacterium]|nr:hypothetical protein [Candidatus Izemoplasmatales bacterium]